MAGEDPIKRQAQAPRDDNEDFDVGLETKPFLAHLEDLRWTLFRCICALGVGVGVSAFGAKWLLKLLYRPLIEAGHDPKEMLRTLGVVDPFSIHMEISLFG